MGAGGSHVVPSVGSRVSRCVSLGPVMCAGVVGMLCLLGAHLKFYIISYVGYRAQVHAKGVQGTEVLNRNGCHVCATWGQTRAAWAISRFKAASSGQTH